MTDRGVGTGVAVLVASSLWLVAFLLASRGAGGPAVALFGAPVVLIAGAVAGRWGGRRAAWWPAAVPPGAAVVAFAATGGADTALASAVGLGILLWCPWLVGRWVRARAALGRAGWRSAARWEEQARVVEQEARLRERARIAADMHDLVGHDLARAALRLGGLELDRGLPDDSRQAVAGAREQVSAAAEHLAQAVSALAADRVPAFGGGAIEAIVAGIEDAGRPVLLVPADPAQLLDDVDPTVCDLAVRVVREGLTNALKHAPEAAVDVSLARRVGGLDVVVRTRGVPDQPPAPGSGRGLPQLADDVAAAGGQLEHGRSGDDHLLAVRLPAHRAARAGDPSTVEADHRRAVGAVQRSRSTAVRGIAAALAVSVLLIAGYRVADVATSYLPTRTFDAMAAGTERADAAPELPLRTRTDGTGIPQPPGAWCEYYSASADPLSLDLFRLCWADGILVGKDHLVRSTSDAGTIGT